MPAAQAAPDAAGRFAPAAPRVQSYAERVAPLDPARLFALGRRAAGGACYWERPAERNVFVGIGAAARIAIEGAASSAWVFAEARREWRRLTAGARHAGDPAAGPRFLGGFAFDPLRPPGRNWDGFPDALLTLPSLLYRQIGDEAWLTCSVALPEGAAEAALRRARDLWLALAGQVRGAGDEERRGWCASTSRPSSPPPLLPSSPHPSELTWQALVADAAGAIRRGEMEKVVLARDVRLPQDEVVDADVALARLRAGATDGFVFAFASGGRCFLGATPERLVRLRAGRVETGALAGSRRRGATAAEDTALAQELLRSAKDRWEHAVVVRELLAGLSGAGVDVPQPPPPSVLTLATVQHLHTPLAGQAPPGCTVLDLVAGLHPSPAVGGYPRAEALAWIRARECLERGWYAGAVGCLDVRGEGEFAVAIRSALLDGAGARLFAGCGIMGDSDPAAEYAESGLKLRPMLAALAKAG